MSLMPWASLPNSLLQEFNHVYLSLHLIRLLHSSNYPVDRFITALCWLLAMGEHFDRVGCRWVLIEIAGAFEFFEGARTLVSWWACAGLWAYLSDTLGALEIETEDFFLVVAADIDVGAKMLDSLCKATSLESWCSWNGIGLASLCSSLIKSSIFAKANFLLTTGGMVMSWGKKVTVSETRFANV